MLAMNDPFHQRDHEIGEEETAPGMILRSSTGGGILIHDGISDRK
jgi:hypothetical protein